jgi:formamidopyrimidine-DNA glycosylase
MPELPEVEFARRCWAQWADGKTVLGVTAQASRILRPRSPKALQALRGATFFDFQRRGKNLLLRARRAKHEVGIWSHLGMTGKWVRRPQGAEVPRFARVRVDLDDGRSLYYCDMRLFGRLQLVPDAAFEEIAELKALGPDPLADGIDVPRLFTRLQATRLPVKVALLDQRLLAGVGNIQASEALHRAGIDPRRAAKSLDRAEVRRLAAAIRKSIDATLKDFQSTTSDDSDITYVEEPGSDNPFAVYDRAGERCSRCKKGTIERIVQAGRSTFFCPNCQK